MSTNLIIASQMTLKIHVHCWSKSYRNHLPTWCHFKGKALRAFQYNNLMTLQCDMHIDLQMCGGNNNCAGFKLANSTIAVCCVKIGLEFNIVFCMHFFLTLLMRERREERGERKKDLCDILLFLIEPSGFLLIHRNSATLLCLALISI